MFEETAARLHLDKLSRKYYVRHNMYQLTVGQFKSKFSQVLEKVLKGESIGITYGKSKKKVATLTPYKKDKSKKIKLGLLEGKASFKIHPDFKMTDEEFLQS